MAERLIDGQRGQRYGEVLAVYAKDEEFYAEVFGTQMINDCPAELWDTLEAPALMEQLGALFVKLNGPRHWVLDGFGTKRAPVEPVMASFNGLEMRRIAILELGKVPMQIPYMDRKVDRGAIFFFDAGKPVFELVNPEGLAYVLQAYCVSVDPTITQDNLADLGAKLNLPEGWSYRTRILEEELVIDTSDTLATVLQDELENSYTLPY
ncbi:MAG: hypothetical protein WCK25_05315 [Actinomycetes bacterium]